MDKVEVRVESHGLQPGRLVVVATSTKSQSINICRSTNEPPDYEATYIIRSPDPYMTLRDVESSRTVEELVEKVVKGHHGVERPKRTGPKPKTKGQG